MKTKVLITSVGSMVAQNILETLKYRRQHLFIVGTDASTDAPLYDCDRIYLVPKSELPPSDFSFKLKKIIEEEDPDLIIPGRDIDVRILAILKKDFPHKIKRFITGSPGLAEIIEDKWLSFKFCLKEGLSFAESVCFDLEQNREVIEDFIRRFGFPLIFKPRKGFASKTVSLILNRDQLYGHESDDRMVLQEYLGDAEKIFEFSEGIAEKGIPLFHSLEEVKYSLQLFIDYQGNLKDRLVTLHKMKNGVSGVVDIYEGHELDDAISSFYEIFSARGWYGPLNIQMQRSKQTGEFKAYEINSRYTGATAARFLLGYDEVGFALVEAGIQIPNTDPRFNTQKTVLKQTYVSERPDAFQDMLRKEKIWNR